MTVSAGATCASAAARPSAAGAGTPQAMGYKGVMLCMRRESSGRANSSAGSAAPRVRLVPWLGLVSFLAAAAPGQAASGQDADDAKLATAEKTLAGWLASDQTDASLLAKVVADTLAAGPAAIDRIGARARQVETAGDNRAGRGLDAVITHLTVAFLERETKSGMTYAGQFDALRGLQPFVGKLLLRLLVDTPDWFSQQERHLLVAPLRDVYPESPGADVLRQLHEVTADEDYEPEAVRQNLAFALAQWGDRSFIEARIARVAKDAAAEGIGADRRTALRYELADIHYTLRDYARAAKIHLDLLRHAEVAQTPLTPSHYYNAACCLARAGMKDAALDELQRAAKLMQGGSVDPSQMLERKLFERDPDLASVRADERFGKIVQTAFGKAGKDG